jgi:hypothetical protein
MAVNRGCPNIGMHELEKGNKPECLKVEKEDEHTCLHCNGGMCEQLFYYSGNPNGQEGDEV